MPKTGDTSGWPRNGAVLQGKSSEVNGMKWLHVHAIKQAGEQEFVDVSANGFFMPEFGSKTNGGRWLHDAK